MSMKAGVLYSGGKDSSFMAVMLKRLGLDVELCTANFGVYESYIPSFIIISQVLSNNSKSKSKTLWLKPKDFADLDAGMYDS